MHSLVWPCLSCEQKAWNDLLIRSDVQIFFVSWARAGYVKLVERNSALTFDSSAANFDANKCLWFSLSGGIATTSLDCGRLCRHRLWWHMGWNGAVHGMHLMHDVGQMLVSILAAPRNMDQLAFISTDLIPNVTMDAVLNFSVSVTVEINTRAITIMNDVLLRSPADDGIVAQNCRSYAATFIT